MCLFTVFGILHDDTRLVISKEKNGHLIMHHFNRHPAGWGVGKLLRKMRARRCRRIDFHVMFASVC